MKRGGGLLATFETSLYDEWGKRRENFGLGDLFGVSYTGKVERDIKNSYIRIEAQTRHPILRGLEDAWRIINTVQRVAVNAAAPMESPLASAPHGMLPDTEPKNESIRTMQVAPIVSPVPA